MQLWRDRRDQREIDGETEVFRWKGYRQKRKDKAIPASYPLWIEDGSINGDEEEDESDVVRPVRSKGKGKQREANRPAKGGTPIHSDCESDCGTEREEVEDVPDDINSLSEDSECEDDDRGGPSARTWTVEQARDKPPRWAFDNARKREVFLRSLSKLHQYQQAVDHVLGIHSSTVLTPFLFKKYAAIPWASWLYKGMRLPLECHYTSEGLQEALQWLSDREFLKSHRRDNRSGELEQTVLAIGMILRDLERAQFVNDPDDEDSFPSVPSFNTMVPFSVIDEVLIPALADLIEVTPTPRPSRSVLTRASCQRRDNEISMVCYSLLMR